jgi:hypothetical protein
MEKLLDKKVGHDEQSAEVTDIEKEKRAAEEALRNPSPFRQALRASYGKIYEGAYGNYEIG